jgi:hypothetical protein
MSGVRPAPPRVLVFSQRNIEIHLWEAPQMEFEDVICEMDSATLVAPPLSWTSTASMWASRAHNGVLRALGRTRRWPYRRVRIQDEYELFFISFHFPHHVTLVDRFRGVRERCRKMACHIIEIWRPDLHRHRNYLQLLRQFDVVFVTNPHVCKPLSEMIERPVVHLPAAADGLRFSPFPDLPARSIDVLNIGRGSDELHAQLQQMAEAREIFYVHARVAHAIFDPRAHRVLVANQLRRTRYFFAYRVNEDRLDRTGGDEAITTRLFEGTSAGAVMLGTAPDCPDYAEYFGWPDVIIHVPWKPENIRATLRELDSEPMRMAEISRNNAVNALRRHDWVHRWERVLEHVGLAPTEATRERKRRLEALADWGEAQSLGPHGPTESPRSRDSLGHSPLLTGRS